MAVQPFRNPEATGVSYGDYLKDRATGGDGYGGSSNPIVFDSGSDQIAKLAKEYGVRLDSTTKDYLTQYYLNEKASENSFLRELGASNTQYQRAVKDLQKAGINPYVAFDALRGSGASSSSGSVSGGLYTSKGNQKMQSATQGISSILSILGIIAAAMIYAL